MEFRLRFCRLGVPFRVGIAVLSHLKSINLRAGMVPEADRGATAPLSWNLSRHVGEKLTIRREISLMITHLYIVQTVSTCL